MGREAQIEEYSLSYQEAKHATKIAHTTNKDLVCFDKMNLHRLLYYPNMAGEMLKFYSDYFKHLKDFDAGGDRHIRGPIGY